MNSKKLTMYILISGGSMLGGYIPKALGAAPFGGFWFLGTVLGLFAGFYVYVKIGQWGQ